MFQDFFGWSTCTYQYKVSHRAKLTNSKFTSSMKFAVHRIATKYIKITVKH